MDEKNNVRVNHPGVGFTGMLTLLFVALKLTGHITWSWWWVLAPVWITGALILILLLVVLLFVTKDP